MKFFKNKKTKNSGMAEIYGFHSVIAALNNANRKHQKLAISQAHKSILTEKIKQNVKEVLVLPNKEMFKLYGGENTHQGIVLTTSSLIQPGLDIILEESINKKIEIVVMLDQVTDPNNIGSIMRSCILFNCKSVIVSKDNAPDITPSIAKAASGALEVVNYVKVTNLSNAIRKFKKNNFWVCGLDINNNHLDNNFDIPKKCLLVLGAEGKGLRKLTKKECDRIISIPMNPNLIFQIDSLNISNACSIALYEHFKKNN
jgi:23S rRNA (guanosine2251-2'-O)-methyltransferase